MTKHQDVKIFIAEIKSTFPEVGSLIDKRMKEMGLGAENYMYTEMMECFSQATTDAIKEKDSETALKYLKYMSEKLENASKEEREYIDTYYTESLMWDIKDRKLKSWGWKLIPVNLKKLYEDMWGEQDL